MTERISAEQWNRTLLVRQHLVERVAEEPIEVIDRCVGVQSQDPRAAFFALWSRIDGFDPAELDALLTDREVVRMALQRGTVFLMDGLDARWIRGAVQPALEASLTSNHLRKLGDVDPAAVVEAARRLFDDDGGEHGISAARLRTELTGRWPQAPADSLTSVARARLPLVQIPPRGLWGRSGAPSYVLLDHWIGPGEPALIGDEARKDLIRMYLRGHGPASAAAVAAWSGLSGLRPLLDAMEADWELVKLAGPDGRELYDLDGLAIAEGDQPVPVRLLAPYDGVLVANADRDRVADRDVYARTVTANGRSPGFVLVDGRLAGTWRLGSGSVELTELVDLHPAQRAEVEREAALLAEFAAG
ncbi:winged helix DNA-binding domain-containing protein [Gordonia sp. PP30]|uniref:winged helix DNA-binding domain-containing protein n=1 Tax=Gordonia sp. PP30 TaxID=2935861 RepID=UPI001FFF8AAF|nr:winged helix DNA-binding domain-containing protein [Gordonia sp. PP30]UQE75170.1 winged helix DNA-binding domain-containing protein [Gordonia sp. PP30]